MTTECAPTTEPVKDLDAQLPFAPPRVSRLRRVFRSFWMRLFLLVFIFTAGGVTGYCVGSIWTEAKFQQIMKQPRPRFESLMTHLKTSLELSDEQSAGVEQIVRRHHTSLEKIRQDVAPQYVAEFDQMDQDMQGVLSDTQKERWKKRATEMREFWASGRRDRGKKRNDGDQRSRDHRPEHKDSKADAD